MAQVETLGYAADPSNPLYTNGKVIRTVVAQISIDADAAAGDIHKLAQGLPVDAHVLAIRLPRGSAQIADLTDVDFGLYRNDNEAVLDADILADGVNFSAAAKTGPQDLLGENLTYDLTKDIGELVSLESDTEPSGGVDICATINAEGSGTGTITVYLDIAFPA